MNKKAIIIAVSALILLAAAAGVWNWKTGKKTENGKNQEQEEIVQQQSQNEQQGFVVEADPDVSHWQTKETEFFTIKFPKEWYWLESIHGEREGYSRVITNNPNFDLAENPEIGILSDIGPRSHLMLLNSTEVVITDRGVPTSNAGTPQDSIDAIFKLAKRNYPSVDCSITNNKTIPFTAYCIATYDSQLQQSYYIINDKISLTLTFRTTKNTLIKKEILDKIAGSIILK